MTEPRKPPADTSRLCLESEDRPRQPHRLRRAKRATTGLIALAILLGLLNVAAAYRWHWPRGLTEFIGSNIRYVWWAAIAVWAWASGYSAGRHDAQGADDGEA